MTHNYMNTYYSKTNHQNGLSVRFISHLICNNFIQNKISFFDTSLVCTCTHTHTHTHSISWPFSNISLAFAHTHTHTHSVSWPFSGISRICTHTHTHTLSLYLNLAFFSGGGFMFPAALSSTFSTFSTLGSTFGSSVERKTIASLKLHVQSGIARGRTEPMLIQS